MEGFFSMGVRAGVDDMRLLDLFCGAGGCSVGYHRAGFEVVGVDINPQPRYPFKFYQGDWLGFLRAHGGDFDVIHASPRCQLDSVTAALYKGPEIPRDELYQVRKELQATGKPYVIENVPGAPLINPLMLCGSMFGLRVLRHRIFECSPVIWWPPATCNHWGKASSGGRGKSEKNPNGYVAGTLENFDFITVTGADYIARDGRKAMGIDWMIKKELSQAIPPAYTEFIGGELLKMLPPPPSNPI